MKRIKIILMVILVIGSINRPKPMTLRQFKDGLRRKMEENRRACEIEHKRELDQLKGLPPEYLKSLRIKI